MNIKNNLSLIFGISIPILMVIFVALSIYIPQFFARPQYNFVYLTGNNICYAGTSQSQIYSVKDNRLVRNIQEADIPKCMLQQAQAPQIFLYNVITNQSKAVSFSDASMLNLSPFPQSPDGFEIVNGVSGVGVFPFYSDSGSDYYSHYITGHNISKKINIQQTGYYYGYNFIFLGWVNK